jgi:Flp pilus assembly pilin Flp
VTCGHRRQASRQEGEVMAIFWRFLSNDRGTTAIEYAFIAGIISGGLIIVFTGMGTKIANKFPSISSALN